MNLIYRKVSIHLSKFLGVHYKSFIGLCCVGGPGWMMSKDPLRVQSPYSFKVESIATCEMDKGHPGKLAYTIWNNSEQT